MVEFKKSKQNIKQLSASKQERAQALLNKIEFMETELDKLQKILTDKGWTENYKNGANQFGIKKSSEAEVYNALIKNYTAAMKQLEDMIPDEEEADSFDKF